MPEACGLSGVPSILTSSDSGPPMRSAPAPRKSLNIASSTWPLAEPEIAPPPSGTAACRSSRARPAVTRLVTVTRCPPSVPSAVASIAGRPAVFSPPILAPETFSENLPPGSAALPVMVASPFSCPCRSRPGLAIDARPSGSRAMRARRSSASPALPDRLTLPPPLTARSMVPRSTPAAPARMVAGLDSVTDWPDWRIARLFSPTTVSAPFRPISAAMSAVP